ncbi:MAG: queuosine precursor transporter [Leptospiraceae bacterium]|nr:queuosine precursor transporter [Leptospiraceae bacterium]
MHLTKPLKLYILLSSIFISFLIMAEVTSSKLFTVFGFVMSFGVVPFPATFIVTDLLNEYFGKKVVRFTTFIGMIMILFAFLIIIIGLNIPAMQGSPVDDVSFERVFFNSGLIIIGSIIAYLIGQLIDIQVFHFLRKKTQGRYIWLRATGSTIISQLIDSYIVTFIAFSKYKTTPELFEISTTNFSYKMLVAIGITPLIYLAHFVIDKYLGEEAKLLKETAHHK